MKSHNFDRIWTIDLEATCWDSDMGDQPEVIEIGHCWLFNDGRIIREPRLFVRPTINPTLSDYCKNLTGITQEQVNTARPLNEVLATLSQKLGPQNHPCAAFGNYDLKQLIEESARKGFHYIHNPTYINVKAVHAFMTKARKGVGLKKAVQECGLVFDGVNHNGSDDAFMAAQVLKYHFKW